jgi:hypothetical protein
MFIIKTNINLGLYKNLFNVNCYVSICIGDRLYEKFTRDFIIEKDKYLINYLQFNV